MAASERRRLHTARDLHRLRVHAPLFPIRLLACREQIARRFPGAGGQRHGRLRGGGLVRGVRGRRVLRHTDPASNGGILHPDAPGPRPIKKRGTSASFVQPSLHGCVICLHFSSSERPLRSIVLQVRTGAPVAASHRMEELDASVDLYETLQISASAEPETVHRVYRLLAQRFHPDNAETGNPERFRQISEAYRVLSDPAERARYDAVYERQRQARWRLADLSASADAEFDSELQLRITVLEVLYTKRRTESQQAGLFQNELEKLTGSPHEHLEFTTWYLIQKKLIQRTDNSMLTITVDGIDYLEAQHRTAPLKRRLAAANA